MAAWDITQLPGSEACVKELVEMDGWSSCDPGARVVFLFGLVMVGGGAVLMFVSRVRVRDSQGRIIDP